MVEDPLLSKSIHAVNKKKQMKEPRVIKLPCSFSEEMALSMLKWFNRCPLGEFDDSAEYQDGTFRNVSRERGLCPSTDRILFLFPNGRGVSIVRSKYTYGGESGLWELGVMAWDYKDEDKDISNASARLDSSTTVAKDVLGWLEPEDAAGLSFDVFELDARKGHQGSKGYTPRVQPLTTEEIKALRAFSSPT